jgi:hypothetical protein
MGAVEDEHGAAGLAAKARRLELGGHAAGATRRAAARQRIELRTHAHELGDAGGAGIESGIGGVEPVDVGHQHQEVGVERHRHARREPVVVAERGLGLVAGGAGVLDQLAHADAVVLVEHRQRAQLEQA